jgi:hypothetical protein
MVGGVNGFRWLPIAAALKPVAERVNGNSEAKPWCHREEALRIALLRKMRIKAHFEGRGDPEKLRVS